MRSKAPDGETWTTTRVRDLRERLGLTAFEPGAVKEETISVDEAATRLKICVGSVKRPVLGWAPACDPANAFSAMAGASCRVRFRRRKNRRASGGRTTPPQFQYFARQQKP